MKIGASAATWIVGAFLVTGSTASAADIKVVASVGVKAVLEALAPQFERSTEHKLMITYGTAVPLKRQIDAGETFDVLILTPAMLEDLAKTGKVTADSRKTVAKAGIGVAIRAGAPKPDIGSVDAFKRTLLDAKSIAYSKEGQSGTAMARLIERLGIADQMQGQDRAGDTLGHDRGERGGRQIRAGVHDHQRDPADRRCGGGRSPARRDPELRRVRGRHQPGLQEP